HVGRPRAARRPRARSLHQTSNSAIDMTLPFLAVATLLLQATSLRPLGTLREQAAIQQEWLRYRLDSVLPRLMRKYGVAMWVIPMREYNEDPVFWALVSPTTLFARRRTIDVFHDPRPVR